MSATASEKASNQASEKASNQASEKASNQASEKASNQSSEKADSEKASEKACNVAPERAQPTAVRLPARSAEDDALSLCGGNDFDREDESDHEDPDNEELLTQMGLMGTQMKLVLRFQNTWQMWQQRRSQLIMI